MDSKTIICVGAVVAKDNAVLAVRQSRGHSLEGQWTIPWGRLEEGESPSDAALRETLEEAGVTASVDGLLGVQELPDLWAGWVAIIYLCAFQGGVPKPDDRETDAARFLTLEQLGSLDEPIEPWSAWIMRRFLQNDLTLIVAKPENPYGSSVGYV